MSKRTVELELATPGLDARGQPVRVPLGVAAAPGATDLAPAEPDLAGEHMLINIGPQHPATHGVLRLVVELDGETVVRVIPISAISTPASRSWGSTGTTTRSSRSPTAPTISRRWRTTSASPSPPRS